MFSFHVIETKSLPVVDAVVVTIAVAVAVPLVVADFAFVSGPPFVAHTDRYAQSSLVSKHPTRRVYQDKSVSISK